MNDLRRALNSLFDVLHLHHDGVDEVIDEAVEALNLMSSCCSPSAHPLKSVC